MNWSDQQVSIFDWFREGHGNLVVRARAGTGKTTTIIHAIDFAPEQSILLGAFNKKIATELQSKLTNPKTVAKTFHSVGYGIIMQNWKGCKLDNDRAERLARQAAGNTAPDHIITLVKKLSALGKNIAPVPTVDRMVEIAYNFDIDPDEYLINEGWNIYRIAEIAMHAMMLACTKDGTFDFDDMLFVPVCNQWVRPRFDLIVIDEAQDMNNCQLEMATKLSKGRIVVVGDDRQAIYGFRGADSNSIDRLKGELIASELGLNITYRCPKNVVAKAALIVKDYKADVSAPEGVVRDLSYEKMLGEATVGDFVLSRKNAPLTKVCFGLLARQKRAVVEGREIGQGIKKVLNTLKAKSIPNLLEKLEKWEEKQLDRLSKSGKKAENKIENLKDQAEVIRVLAANAKGLETLNETVDMMFQQTDGGKLDMIVCSSVHKAKGLERDRVYGLVETLYPGTRKSIEEENIEYVMITRAKKEFISVFGIH